MYAACTLPAINDSLISGHPLYLLHSYSRGASAAGALPLLAAFAMQATGSVRLQVTGRPPTCNGPFFSAAQDSNPIGKAAAAPCNSRLRCSRCAVATLPAFIAGYRYSRCACVQIDVGQNRALLYLPLGTLEPGFGAKPARSSARGCAL